MQRDSHMYQKTVLASELYYSYNLSQEEVAKQLGVSRPWISKLLKQAEEMGIVRIEVMTPSGGIADMERAMEKRFSLKKSKVVKNMMEANDMVNVSRAAANYIISILRPEDTIGVSWGRTLSSVANEFIPLHYPNVKVLPLVGGFGKNPEILSNQVANKMAFALSCQCILMHAPAFTIGKAERDIFLKDPFIKDIIQRGENVNIAVLGLGALRGSTIEQILYISPEEVEDLAKLGAVGDIALAFIDRQGKKVEHGIHDRLVSAELYKVRKNAREVIGVAVGKNKVPVIQAALEGKWLDVFITDANTAEELLK